MPSRARIRPARMPVVAGAILVMLTACVPEGATGEGRDVSGLYNLFMVLSAGVFLLVNGLLAWSILRYRGEPGRVPARMPPQIHGDMRLEIAWWALPTLLVIVLAVLSALVLSRVDARSAEAMEVEVQGFQWGWRFTYPDGTSLSGTAYDPATITLPTDTRIAFVIESRDVIHSFSIPPFLVKRDAIPGHENRLEVEIADAGTYAGQCGEFCGLLHSYQVFTIEAVEPAAFESWLDSRQAAEAAP